ncbi:MAG TPA: glycosyltransferase family 39 protein [Patescibacteria group bacterium]|nr:glycosyltransferase family 39 protein [Patescibacteria group bacterium]
MNRLLLFFIIIIAFFLIFYRISSLIPFFNDQGWFYLSARDMLTKGIIPLVGIASSHPWLHQGALWTYLLTLPLLLSRFNPASGAIFTGMLGLGTVILVYFIGKNLFSVRVGLISSFFYATSPLVINNARTAYHTSPIPFFTALLILAFYAWIKGNKKMFPMIIGLLAVLYNFEIATVSLTFVFLLILLYGIRFKKSWAKIWNKKLLFFSAFAWFIPMLPMLLYDTTHGFPQTLKFIAWIGYKVIAATGLYHLHNNSLTDWGQFFKFLYLHTQMLIFIPNGVIALVLLLCGFISLLYLLRKKMFTKDQDVYLLIFVIFLVPLAFVLVGGVASDAYLPILYVPTILILSLFLSNLMRSRIGLIIVSILIFFIGGLNVYSVLSTQYLSTSEYFEKGLGIVPLTEIEKQTNVILVDTKNKKFTIKGIGVYKNLTDNYQYIIYWMHGSLISNSKNVYIIQPEKDYKNTKNSLYSGYGVVITHKIE